jgi:polyferredoxin
VSAQSRGKRVVWVRRAVQIASALLFFELLRRTHSTSGAPPGGFVRIFFDLDPLVLLSTCLATHTLEGLSLLALATVGLTLLLGRVFCGWLCPLGAVHHALTWLRSRRRRGAPARELYSPWQRAKYYVLLALLVMGLLGAQWTGVLDPIAMLYRGTVIAVLPALRYGVEETATAVDDADPRLGPLRGTDVSEPVHRFVRDRVLLGERQVFTGSTIIALVFLAALLLNLYRPRFWCRYVCPLGALLGLLARRGSMRLRNRSSECVSCGLCAIRCPAAAQPEKPGEWLADECFGCWNCVAACKREGVDFEFRLPWRKPEGSALGVSRRGALRSLGAGAAALFVLRLPPEARGQAYESRLIRPPGSRAERDFLKRCLACGTCMKVCPTNALHPSLTEGGLAGLWTPIVVPRIGYCEYECNLCGQACPTEAIRPLSVEEKKQVRIGLACIDATRCLPYAYDRDCIVCEEHCPIPTKAITFVEREVVGRDGVARLRKQPRVDVDRCNGCGICETKCPFEDEPAIRVTSANESRHPGNQPILPAAGTLDLREGRLATK